MPFQCTVVTPEQQAFDAPIVQAIIPAHDGLLGVLSNRAPLLVKLGTGALRLDLPGGLEKIYFVDGGVAQMKDNRLTILCSEAIPAADLDYEAARADYAHALEIRALDDQAFVDREHLLARARVKQRLAPRPR